MEDHLDYCILVAVRYSLQVSWWDQLTSPSGCTFLDARWTDQNMPSREVAFGKITLQSSVVMNVDLHWVTFDGRYSVGYLLKLLTNGSLPDTMSRFFDLDNICFPSVYEVLRCHRQRA